MPKKYRTIRILHVTGRVVRHRILSKRRKEYSRVLAYKGYVYVKIKRVIVPPIPPPPPPPVGNVKAIAFLKIIDYGTDGHLVSFECWTSRVFAPDETDKIDSWYNDSKTYMTDKLTEFGFDESLTSQIIFGLELRKQSTTDSIGSTDDSFKYRHKDGKWKKF